MVRILIDSVWHEGISLEAWRKEAVRTKQTIRLHSVLLRRFLIGDNTEVSIIDCVAMYAMNVVLFKPFFGLFVQFLWDEKVIGDEALLLWKEQVEEEEVNVELLKDESIRKIMQYLQDSESSYDSDSSYSESDSSEESDSEESGSEESGDSSEESDTSSSEESDEDGTSNDDSNDTNSNTSTDYSNSEDTYDSTDSELPVS